MWQIDYNRKHTVGVQSDTRKLVPHRVVKVSFFACSLPVFWQLYFCTGEQRPRGCSHLLTGSFPGWSAFFPFFIVTWTWYFFSIHRWICLFFVSKSCCPIFEEKMSSFVTAGPGWKQWSLLLGLFLLSFETALAHTGKNWGPQALSLHLFSASWTISCFFKWGRQA